VTDWTKTIAEPDELIVVDLKNPWIAALLAWAWPGLGHLYQGRHAKGVLYMVCILSTFVFGLVVSGGHAVYASWTKEDKRYPFICQAAVGLPAFPALVQNHLRMSGREPMLGGFMAPPRQPVNPEGHDELSDWNRQHSFGLELGTVYTMIAGLLNLLAIYDALAGPALAAPDEEESEKPPSGDKGARKDGDGKDEKTKA
jgi:hypothetical protein